jgi:hypothetical protein
MFTRFAIIASCCMGAAAHAADNGVYLGIGVGHSEFNTTFDSSDTGYKAIAGVRLLDSFSIEANYADHGDATTTSAFALGFLDFPLLDLFAKAGMAQVKSIGTETQFAWGAGVQVHFGSLGARTEYEEFKLPGSQKLRMVSASLVYTFL